METIKISVEVSVNLSENTQNFIKSLFNSTIIPAPAAPAPAPAPATAAPAPAPAAPAATKPAKTTKSAPAAPTKSAPAAPAAPTKSGSKSIEEVRALLVTKVFDHRAAIKQKLEELGAPSVSKLDPSKYEEMFNFLTEL